MDANVGFHPLYWVASLDEDSNNIYVKLANAGAKDQAMSLNLLCKNATVVAGEKLTMNTPKHPRIVGLRDLKVVTEQGGSKVNLPAWSVAVLVCGKS